MEKMKNDKLSTDGLIKLETLKIVFKYFLIYSSKWVKKLKTNLTSLNIKFLHLQIVEVAYWER
jgi:hypothetical protein